MLLRRGSLTVPELVRYLNAPSISGNAGSSTRMTSTSSSKEKGGSKKVLPVRLVQQALIVLIQHHCVLHSRPANDSVMSGEEYFEIHTDEVLCRLRFGTYLYLAKEWGGKDVRHQQAWSHSTGTGHCSTPLIPWADASW